MAVAKAWILLANKDPDIGYGIIYGAIIFTLSGIIGAFVRSKLPLLRSFGQSC
jgi:hypothetical protein